MNTVNIPKFIRRLILALCGLPLLTVIIVSIVPSALQWLLFGPRYAVPAIRLLWELQDLFEWSNRN